MKRLKDELDEKEANETNETNDMNNERDGNTLQSEPDAKSHLTDEEYEEMRNRIREELTE